MSTDVTGTGGSGATDSGTDAFTPEAPTLEATGQLDPQSIVTDEKAVYWCNRGTNVDNKYPNDDGSVMKLSFDGEGPAALAKGGSPIDIAIDDQFVYWADENAIRRVSKV